MSRETQAQIHLGALWFVKPEHAYEGFSINNLFSPWPSGESRDTWLNAYERVLNYHHQAGATNLMGLDKILDWPVFINEAHTQKSCLHWITWYLCDLDYTRRRLSKNPQLASLKRRPFSFPLCSFQLEIHPEFERSFGAWLVSK
jgi:hypothetical protein